MKRKTLETAERSPERLKILERIAELERLGGDSFYIDVEDDPSGHELRPDEVDYLRKKPSSKIKTLGARAMAAILQPLVRKDLQITVEGEENLAGIEFVYAFVQKIEGVCQHSFLYAAVAHGDIQADLLPQLRHRQLRQAFRAEDHGIDAARHTVDLMVNFLLIEYGSFHMRFPL